MTALEMKELLLLKFDGLFESSAPAYSNSQLSEVLSNAQRRIVRDIDSPNSSKNYGGFDHNERVRKYLGALISPGNPTLITPTYNELYPNGVGFTLPSDHWYTRSERAEVNSVVVSVAPITHDYYEANKDNPYKKPTTEFIWSVTAGDKVVELIPGNATDTINSYSIVYTKEVPDIDIDGTVDCILHEDLHDDIVDMAYQIMTGASTPEYYNISNNEANNN